MTTKNFTAISGDTYDGMIGTVKRNGVNADLTDAKITATFFRNKKEAFLWSTEGDSPYIVINTENSTYTLAEKKLIEAEPYDYSYRVRIVFNDGVIKTVQRGTASIQ